MLLCSNLQREDPRKAQCSGQGFEMSLVLFIPGECGVWFIHNSRVKGNLLRRVLLGFGIFQI